jgi:GGDEF domain-containing protein
MFRIALLVKDEGLASRLELHLRSKDYHAVVLDNASSALGMLYADPPDILLIDIAAEDAAASKNILDDLKHDSYFSMMPIIGLLPEGLISPERLAGYSLDDFITHPINYPILFSRIALATQRIRRVLDNNPLTRLPGNTSIQIAIERAIGKPLAVCYLDINNFKPFNDTYGFSRGDEVIRMVARISNNAVKEVCGSGFSGHIGGDDFVLIVPMENAEAVCKTIIGNFDLIVQDVFGEKEKDAGYYLAKNRNGKLEKIPLLGLAIAVVPTAGDHIKHPGMVSEIASDLKKHAKKSPNSAYVIDRRKN